ncbi:MAG: Extracellular solute-binding protein family 5, partial [Parcubacteria group bacterium GW2011_GWC2_45_7]
MTLTTYDEPTYLKVAEFIRDTWQKLGVKVKLEAASKDNFQREVLRPRAYEVLLFSIVAGALPDPYPFWHSSQMDDPGLNLSSVRAREIDALLE